MATRLVTERVQGPAPQFFTNEFQRGLARWNHTRLAPQFPTPNWQKDLEFDLQMLRLEGGFVDVSEPRALALDEIPGIVRDHEQAARNAKAAGFDGLIIPDLPPEEAGEFHAACRKYELDLIFLLAPTSTDERIKKIAALSSGFIYCVALRGITGARTELAGDLGAFLERVRQHSDLPRAVGFGISRPEHVAQVAQMAEGAICASALLDYIGKLPAGERVEGTRAFVYALREAADQHR